MRNIRSKWVVGRSKKWKEGKNECKNIGLTICNKELKIKRLVEWTTLQKKCQKLKKGKGLEQDGKKILEDNDRL